MNLIELQRSLRQLRLGGMATVLETRLRQAQSENMPPVDLMSCLVSDELHRRSDRLLERRRKQAAFRDPDKTLDNFDFNFNPKMNSSLVFEEVERRKQAIHRLLVNARTLADELRGVATDNQAQLRPALQEVEDLLDLLNSKDKELKATLNALGPYASILGNIIGTGPWFDAYAVNLAAIPTGEFLPGPRDE